MVKFYYITGDRSNAWVHAYSKSRWFVLNPESYRLEWQNGKVEPIGRRISEKEVKEMKLPKLPNGKLI